MWLGIDGIWWGVISIGALIGMIWVACLYDNIKGRNNQHLKRHHNPN